MNKIYICFLLLLIIISCNEKKKDYYTFPNQKWNTDSIIVFDIENFDTINVSKIQLSIRHTTSYSYQNLILFLHHYNKGIKIYTNTLNIDLSMDNGSWIGNGKSDIRELIFTNDKSRIFKSGIHTIKLELAMRENNNIEISELNHISDISVHILNNE